MDLSLSRLKNLFGGSTGRRVRLRLSREDIVVYGIFAIILIFTALIFGDGYLFYQTVVVPDSIEIFSPKVSFFSEEQVNEVIRLLDEREDKFKTLLEGVPSEGK